MTLMPVLVILLHEIFPSGPWVFMSFVVLGLAFMTPLYMVRRKYGGTLLAIATIVEVIVGVVLAGDDSVVIPAAVGGAGAALILHQRALRRPDGHAIVDIGLAVGGFWVTLVIFLIGTSVVLG